MFNNANEEQRLLCARVKDLLRAADRGEVVRGAFLSPAEAAYAMLCLSQTGEGDRALLYGGYPDAERKRLIVLPTYIAELGGSPEEALAEYYPDELADAVRAVRIRGSGYRALSHRDYLGAILSLGIDRSAVGDVVTEGEHSAAVFCTEKICPYICSSLERVATDKVTVTLIGDLSEISVKKELLPMKVSVASERFDCAVAALTGLSREKAGELIRSGLCQLDYIAEERCDRRIEPPCTVTVRGHGKFAVRAFDGETRRGRLRLLADRYV